MKAKILNSREKRKLAGELSREYGTEANIFDGHELLQSGKDVWVASRGCLKQNLEGLRVDSLGLLLIRGGRPTIHGVQLLFKTADLTKLTEDEAKRFIVGEPVGKKGAVASYREHPLDLAEESPQGMKRRKARI